MSIRKIKTELKKHSQSELIDLVHDLYKKIPQVETYLNAAYTNDYDKIIEEKRKKIERFIYPSGREMKIKDKEARNLIKEINRLEIPEITCELEFYYVEYATEVLRDFGHVNDSFLQSIYSAFQNGIENINKINAHNEYNKRIQKIITNASDHDIYLDY